MPQVIGIPMPEAGAEREVVWHKRHNCPQAKALRSVLEDEELDLLQFPVGHSGMELPSNVPFMVTSTDKCRACGQYPTLWFVWTAPKLWLP